MHVQLLELRTRKPAAGVLLVTGNRQSAARPALQRQDDRLKCCLRLGHGI